MADAAAAAVRHHDDAREAAGRCAAAAEARRPRSKPAEFIALGDDDLCQPRRCSPRRGRGVQQLILPRFLTRPTGSAKRLSSAGRYRVRNSGSSPACCGLGTRPRSIEEDGGYFPPLVPGPVARGGRPRPAGLPRSTTTRARTTRCRRPPRRRRRPERQLPLGRTRRARLGRAENTPSRPTASRSSVAFETTLGGTLLPQAPQDVHPRPRRLPRRLPVRHRTAPQPGQGQGPVPLPGRRADRVAVRGRVVRDGLPARADRVAERKRAAGSAATTTPRR